MGMYLVGVHLTVRASVGVYLVGVHPIRCAPHRRVPYWACTLWARTRGRAPHWVCTSWEWYVLRLSDFSIWAFREKVLTTHRNVPQPNCASRR
jgi:hypothetical protein